MPILGKVEVNLFTISNMSILRQYIAPLLIVLVFVFALVAVTIRAFLPGDLLEPAPVVETIVMPSRSLI